MLYIWRMMPREIRQFIQEHIASGWQNHGFSSKSPAPKPTHPHPLVIDLLNILVTLTLIFYVVLKNHCIFFIFNFFAYKRRKTAHTPALSSCGSMKTPPITSSLQNSVHSNCHINWLEQQ